MAAVSPLPTPAAAFLGLRRHTLNRWRCESSGPPWHKFGSSVLYRPGDLREWADGQNIAAEQ